MTARVPYGAGRFSGPAQPPPDRYDVRDVDGARVLVCLEAPTLRVRIERGLVVTASAAKSSPAGTIYLDGAAEGEPFLDVKKHVYNLDHHHGCVRAFTLATCEQALVLVRKGFDLQAREWTVWANEPDLDTVLAIWVLLNHMRLKEADPNLLDAVIPLIRLEGSIDVHGLEMQDLTGLPLRLRESTYDDLKALGTREASLKSAGEWSEVDFADYTHDVLRRIDALLYPAGALEAIERIDEVARAEIPNGGFVVACRSDAAIYEVEKTLRRLYGQRLGMIVLVKDEHTYTLRQVDPFLPTSLEEIYERLNLIDPAAGNRRSGNRWGGSAEIGGSPRRSGSRLSPKQVVETCRTACERTTAWQRVLQIGRSALAAAGVVAAGLVAASASELLEEPFQFLKHPWPPGPDRSLPFIFAVGAASLVLMALALGRGAGLYGLRRPIPGPWWPWLAIGGLAGLAGGAWIPQGDFNVPGAWLMVSLLALSVEIVFRGVVYGDLVYVFGIQRGLGRWRPSGVVWLTSLIYALFSVLPLPLLRPEWTAVDGLAGWAAKLLVPVAAAAFGLATGMIRDRSESLLPSALLHVAVGLVLWGLSAGV